MAAHFSVGIDIGSTTIKVVVLNEVREVVYKTYTRHFSEINTALKHCLEELKNVTQDQEFTIALTGSAGMGIAQRLGLPFVQEVIACSVAVRDYIPETDTVVELGGEDAKITYFGRASEQRMNGVCAGGTGAFIDHMASLLSTDASGLNRLAEKGTQIYTIASRCGVFAKTDIQALMNDGISKPNIALSIFQAVVNQTIGGLAQGRPISGKVAFLGGPLHFLPVLKQRFVETLKLKPENIVSVEDGCYFVALGASAAEERQTMNYTKLEDLVKQAQLCEENCARATDFVLFKDETEYDEFRQRHAKHVVKKCDLSEYQGPLYIGIDAGSTTTKLAVIGQHKELLYTAYGSNQGTPLKTIVDELKELYEKISAEQYIAAVFTTGYGEALFKAALHADGGEVETVAHLRAAQEFCQDVSFVLDIGGQDMKCFFVQNGNIGNITLNEACSAGCGSFIENFAQGLNLTVGEFAKKALQSKAPVDLGTRCTVFMNSRVKQAQKEGAELSDISAGIALSVIKNALFKVMQLKDTDILGDNIVVQGGTFYNDAVLRALELLIGKNVMRPDIAGLMGAYGAALLALESGIKKTDLLSTEGLEHFSVTTKSYRCNGCGNKCLITVQTFADGNRYFTGNRCERGIGKEKEYKDVPNIYEYKYDRLFNYYRPLGHPSRGRIGIPRVLNIYEDYPFWFTFFTMLGYEVVLSEKSTAELYYKGMATIPSDSLCYPAKLVHGHIMDLVEKGVETIFYPCLPYNIADDNHPSDNNYNCPVVASYAENIRVNMDILKEKNIKFMQPFLPINSKKRMLKRLTEEFRSEQISKNELAAAVEAAYIELEHYKEDVRAYCDQIWKKIETENIPAVILAGRPYHIDPEINHGIPEMIKSYGLPVLSEDALYHLPIKNDKLSVVNQWSYHSRLYHAASFVAEHDKLTLIQLSSFGCGLDAITTGQVKSILEKHNKIYTMIKLDEVSNLGAARIRVRSLMAALARQTSFAYQKTVESERPHFTPECRETHTILMPQLAPIQFALIKSAFKKHGYQVVVPEMDKDEAVNLGLRYVNNDMCYPAIVVIGQLLAALKSRKCDPDSTSIMLFQTCGACRASNYLNLMRTAVKDAGFGNVPVFACWGMESETDAFVLKHDCFIDVVKAVVYGDLLMQVRNRTLPYEKVIGSVDALYQKCFDICKKEIVSGNYFRFKKNIKKIVEYFDHIELDETVKKPKVGIVGEILVKYHPIANNHIEEVLLKEGAEVVMPSLMDFVLYLAYDNVVKYKLLAGKYIDKLKSEMFIQLLEFFNKPLRKALRKSNRFVASLPIDKIADLASQQVSLGNMAGEGWFLTGEMMHLIDSGTPNVVCLQPFACLPNHITGKGVLHGLRDMYPDSNVVALDCDAGASEVNQLNRLKLMMSVAKEKLLADE